MRQHLRPCEVSASRPNPTGAKWPASRSLGEGWSSIWVSLPVFLLGRSLRTATSVYLSTPMLGKWLASRSPSAEWKMPAFAPRLRRATFTLTAFGEGGSPVRGLHPPKRFCRPLPGLLGQRDFGLNAIRGGTNQRAESNRDRVFQCAGPLPEDRQGCWTDSKLMRLFRQEPVQVGGHK